MNIIGLKELRQNFEHYSNKVKEGKTFIVVKKSRPLFKITPISEDEDWEEVIDFTKIKKGGVNIKNLLSRL